MTKKSLTVSARCVGKVDVNFWKGLSANGADGMQVEKGTMPNCRGSLEVIDPMGSICDVAFAEFFFLIYGFSSYTYTVN